MTYKTNERRQDPGLDFVAPFVEIVGLVLKLLLELMTLLIGWLLRKGGEAFQERVLKRHVVKPLTKKMLYSKKTTGLEDTLGYAVNKGRPFNLRELQMERHTGIIGTTGSGKSVLLGNLQEHALGSGRSIVFFDPKSSHENIENFISICEKHGRRAHVVSDYYKDATCFNPLLEGDLGNICERIMNALDWSDSFYRNESQMALLKALHQIMNVQGEDVTVRKLLEVLEKSQERKNISGLLSQLFTLDKSEYGTLIDASRAKSLTYDQIREEGVCVYIGISALGMGSAGNILNKLYFGGLLHHCRNSYTRRTTKETGPMSLFFVELSSVIHEGFIDLQNKCRGARMEITYATQCTSDIDRLGENLTSQIFENTNNLFIFNQMVPKHTEFFAKTCGTIQTLKKTFATQEGIRSDNGSEREVEEFLVHANILRNLRVGQCVFLQRAPKRLELLNVRFGHKNTMPVRNSQRVAGSVF